MQHRQQDSLPASCYLAGKWPLWLRDRAGMSRQADGAGEARRRAFAVLELAALSTPPLVSWRLAAGGSNKKAGWRLLRCQL